MMNRLKTLGKSVAVLIAVASNGLVSVNVLYAYIDLFYNYN